MVVGVRHSQCGKGTPSQLPCLSIYIGSTAVECNVGWLAWTLLGSCALHTVLFLSVCSLPSGSKLPRSYVPLLSSFNTATATAQPKAIYYIPPRKHSGNARVSYSLFCCLRNFLSHFPSLSVSAYMFGRLSRVYLHFLSVPFCSAAGSRKQASAMNEKLKRKYITI